MEDFRVRQSGPDAGQSDWPHDNLSLTAALLLPIIFKGVTSFQFLKLAFLIFLCIALGIQRGLRHLSSQTSY